MLVKCKVFAIFCLDGFSASGGAEDNVEIPFLFVIHVLVVLLVMIYPAVCAQEEPEWFALAFLLQGECPSLYIRVDCSKTVERIYLDYPLTLEQFFPSF